MPHPALAGQIASCPNSSCGGPVFQSGPSESGLIRWIECVLCGAFYGLKVSAKMAAQMRKDYERGVA